MTTSPTPTQEERKGTPNDVSNATAVSTSAKGGQNLTEERVSNIGWYFIKSYYDFYIAKLDVIHKIYHGDASILHDAFPEEDKDKKKNGDDGEDELTTCYKAKGTDAIKKCFAEHISGGGNDKNRIVITSATFQVSLEKNIIIVTFGEWSKNDSPFKQFTQTFVLTPGKRESTYDVANDVLKFVESNGFKNNQQVQDDVKKEESVVVDEKLAASAIVDGDAVEKQKETAAEPEKEKVGTEEKADKKEKDLVPEVKREAEVEKKEQAKIDLAEPKKEETPKSEPAEKQQPPAAKEEKKPEEPAKPKSSSQPMTWADLAYQAVPASKPASKPTTAISTTTSTPIATKKTPVSASQQQSHQSTGGSGRFKKDEWYPIYIRGIRSIDEKTLRDHITKKFGELKFFRTNQNIALCDFVLKEAQKKALEAKETTLDGVVINLEPRESKTGNNFHNNTSGNNNNGGYKRKFGDKDGKDKFSDKKGGGINGGGGAGGKFVDGKKVAGNATGGNKQKLGKLNAAK